jgi:antitoxin VapB
MEARDLEPDGARVGRAALAWMFPVGYSYLSWDIHAALIEDPKVAEVADRLRKLTHAVSKTEAVGKALESALKELERPIEEKRREKLAERLEEAVAIARRIGAPNEEFDHKAFSDEMWGI